MFKKTILAIAILSSIQAEEAPSLPKGIINNLNANYVSPRGSGTAKHINLEEFGQFDNAKLEVENYNGLLMFSVEDKSFELDLSMLGINDADKINLGQLHFTNQGKQIKLSLGSAAANDTEFNLGINGGSINCTRIQELTDIKDDLLNACLKNGNFSINRFNMQSAGSQFYNILNEAPLGSDIKLESIRLNISNNSLRGELKGNVTQDVKVKIEGGSWYNPANNEIKLRIDKAKAGWFNVKKTLFKELSKMQSDTLKVRSPYIYFYLKDE